MAKWKDLYIVYKLVISYSLIIFAFLAAGFFIGKGLYNYKKELAFTTQAYIPLVKNTNKIERLTNQSMSYLWRFTAQNDIEYYNTSKSTLSELSGSLAETEKIINLSPDLSLLKSRLVRITSWQKELVTIVDETADIQNRLFENMETLKDLEIKLAKTAEGFISKEENNMYSLMRSDTVQQQSLILKHREVRRINLTVRKGNSSMITALEAIKSKNPEHLQSAIREFTYIFNLIRSIDTLFTEPYQFEAINQFKTYFTLFQNELYSLKKNLDDQEKITVKQIETANVVIYEARAMGEDGMRLSKEVIEKNYSKFYNLILIFIVSLLIALVLAVIFSAIITKSITFPLAKSVKFAEEIASGNLDSTLRIESNDEVGILTKSLENMGTKLKENIADLQQIEREMLTVSIETEEAERKRLAADLHDSLGPLLSTIKLFINAIKNPNLENNKRELLLNRAEEIIEDAIITAKDISYNLLPNSLSDFGLDVAIRSFCDQIIQATNIKINYYSQNYPSHLNRKTETMLFWVLKELINNTINHSKATQVDISLFFDSHFFNITYSDNGEGFNINEKRKQENNKSRGLKNIFNRVKYIGGHIAFASNIGEGVNVKIWLEKEKME